MSTDDPTGAGNSAVGDDNVPGFEYAQRVTTSAIRALTAHGEELNDAWSQIRRGQYDSKAALNSWARLTEKYFGIFVEIMRGPVPMPRPAWLVIPYSKKKPPSPSFSVRIDGHVDRGTMLGYTKFEAVGAAKAGVGIFDGPPQAAGNRVEIQLKNAAIQKLAANTDHMAFIFRQGVGNASPLVIVVLRIIP